MVTLCLTVLETVSLFTKAAALIYTPTGGVSPSSPTLIIGLSDFSYPDECEEVCYFNLFSPDG